MAPLNQRSDVKRFVDEHAKIYTTGDVYCVFKYSNRCMTEYEAWSDVTMAMEDIHKSLLNGMPGYSGMMWGVDAFESGFPHVNCLISKKPDVYWESKATKKVLEKLWHERVPGWEEGTCGVYVQKVTYKMKFGHLAGPREVVGYLVKRALEHRKAAKAFGIWQINKMVQEMHTYVDFVPRKSGPKKVSDMPDDLSTGGERCMW